jgi:hypothetical protein
MGRPVGGVEMLGVAQEMTRQAKVPVKLRQAQAVVLSLAYGLSLEETAQAIGQAVI